MPAEWEPHQRTWMAWPCSGYTLGQTESDWNEARAAWAAVANVVVEFEPVSMLCDPDHIEVAQSFLNPKVELVTAELDDAWMRDIGPTFVRKSNGSVAAVNWVFNGWGAQGWSSWEKDSQVATRIADITESPLIDSWLVNEGGGIAVNGADTVLLTKTVQLGEGRNSSSTQTEVEQEIHRCLGTSNAIWLERGLTRDYEEFGTRGHVDIVAAFCSTDTILYHDQQDPSHPDFQVSKEVRKQLAQSGRFRLVPVPAPKTLRDSEGWVDYSYINHYVVNGGVILCSFNDPNDRVAYEIIQSAYPDRKIVQVDATPLFARGGGIHCITQQQPM